MPVPVADEIAVLRSLDRTGLRTLWEQAFGNPAPRRIYRELLLRAVAHHRQERAIGGLTPAERRRLARAAGDLGNGRVASAVTVKPGTRLLREWHGVMHEVIVLEQGVEYRGRIWSSLSAVASEITGARWSGPRFFGLDGART